MELVDLETFVTVVREGTLSAAARRHFLSQPAVSARMRRLERDLGRSLLERSGRGVQPTPAGKRLFERAVTVLRNLEDLDRDLDEHGPLRGRLDVGATDLVAVQHLPRTIRKLRRAHPELELAIRVEGTLSLCELVERGEIELALGTLPVRTGALASTPIFVDPLAVIAPSDHPLAGRRSIAPSRLGSEIWILHKRDSVTRQQVEDFFATHEVRPRVEMEISNPEAIKELVHGGLGVSVLPERAVRREISSGRLARLRVRDFRLDRVSGLIEHRTRSLTRAASVFRERVVSAAGGAAAAKTS